MERGPFRQGERPVCCPSWVLEVHPALSAPPEPSLQRLHHSASFLVVAAAKVELKFFHLALGCHNTCSRRVYPSSSLSKGSLLIDTGPFELAGDRSMSARSAMVAFSVPSGGLPKLRALGARVVKSVLLHASDGLVGAKLARTEFVRGSSW